MIFTDDNGNPTARPRLPRTLGFAAVFTLGLAAVSGSVATLRAPGYAAILIGSGGLMGSAWRLWRDWQTAKKFHAASARRAAIRAARRERETRRRARRLHQRQIKATALAKQAETRALQRRTQQERALEEAARRAGREQTLLEQADRLRALSDTDLAAEAAAIFAQRGFRTQTQGTDAACDLTLIAGEDSGTEVARCVPAGRIATGTDVQALETWRQTAGARHAYLIAPAGFSSSAVRAVRDLPITLVEAHLLAHWRHLTAQPL